MAIGLFPEEGRGAGEFLHQRRDHAVGTAPECRQDRMGESGSAPAPPEAPDGLPQPGMADQLMKSAPNNGVDLDQDVVGVSP